MTPPVADSTTVPETEPRARRPPLLLLLFFAVGLLFTAIGIVECGFIGYDWASGGALSGLRAPDLGRGVRSWTMHHAMRPGYSDSAARLNSFGLRSPEVAVPKPAGTPRILVLGDSFTFGFRAAEEDVFVRRLENRLRAQGLPALEVVNAGVVSYCPLLEYLQYKHQLHVLQPDLVILNFDMSDVQDHLEYSRDGVWSDAGVPLYVTEPSLGKGATAWPQLLSFQWVARKFNAATRRYQSAAEKSPFARDLDRYLWTFDGNDGWEKEAASTMAPIAELSKLLQHDHIPLIVATYPQPWQVAANATPYEPIRTQYGVGMNKVHLNDRPFKLLERFTAEHGIPFMNAAPVFRADADPASLFLQTDFHFSPRGNDLYAQLLAARVTAMGFGSASFPGGAPLPGAGSATGREPLRP
ncbi:MAG: hypothetical protein ABI051_09770 [Vicinamibacterales bacterium]